MKSTKILRTLVNEHMLHAENNNIEFRSLCYFLLDNEVKSIVTKKNIVYTMTSFMQSENPLRIKHILEGHWLIH